MQKRLYCALRFYSRKRTRGARVPSRRSYKRIVAANVRPDPLCCIWTETPVRGCDKPWFASSTSSLPGFFSKSVVLTSHCGCGTTGDVSIPPPADSLDRGGSISSDHEFKPSRLHRRWAYLSDLPRKVQAQRDTPPRSP